MSLEQIPTYFSDYMGITLEAAQAILSIVVILAVLLPILYLARGKYVLAAIMIFFLTEAFLVGIGWLDFWLLIGTLTVAAMGVATLGVNAITRG